jgi:uroporphyrinogen-III synthase
LSEPRTLILTRPRDQAEAFAAAVEARLPGRFRPVIAPLLDIVPVAAALDLDGLQGILFTSANGVAAFAARTPERGLTAWCVGEMTAAAARQAGFAAQSADGDVVALSAQVVAAHRPGGGAFLHVRGRHAAGDLAGRLAAHGIAIRAAELYDQQPCPLDPAVAPLLRRRDPVVAVFSPRSARLLAEAAPGAGWDLTAATTLALSAAADAPLAGLAPARRIVAPAPTRAGMLAALAAL